MCPMYAVGFNGFNQFPSINAGSSVSNPHPIQDRKAIYELPARTAPPIQLSISWDSLCLITADGRLEITGYHSNLQLDVGEQEADIVKYADVACNMTHIATVSQSGDGRLLRWTPPSKVGAKANPIYTYKPTKPDGAKMILCFLGDHDAVFLTEAGIAVWISLRSEVIEAQPLPIGGRVTHASCGKEHVLLLIDNGAVYSFGHGSRGQLGHGLLDAEPDPRPIECLEGIRIVGLEAGGWHSAAVSAEGDLYTWGWNESGQLGFPMKSPSRNPPSSSITEVVVVTVQATPKCVDFGREIFIASVSCGSRHTATLTSDHDLWTFGWNAHGQLGFEDPPMIASPTYVTDRFAKYGHARCGGWSTVLQAQMATA